MDVLKVGNVVSFYDAIADAHYAIGDLYHYYRIDKENATITGLFVRSVGVVTQLIITLSNNVQVSVFTTKFSAKSDAFRQEE